MALCALLACLLSAGTVVGQQPPPSGFRHRVDVRLVLVPTSVSGAEGAPLTDLEGNAFEIYEDGVLRPLKVFEKAIQLPLQLVLMVDTSLSAAKELKGEKEAMRRFISTVLRPEDAAALVELSGDARTVVEFSSVPAQLEKGLDEMKARAGTALYDAIVETAGLLKEREGRRVMVLITDGNDTTSKSDFRQALEAAQQADVILYGILVRPIPGESGRSVRGEHVLIELADFTGGQVFFPAAAEEMDKFFNELSRVLRTQYLLGFSPLPSGNVSELRTIEVRVKGGNYQVRHRKGYYTDSLP